LGRVVLALMAGFALWFALMASYWRVLLPRALRAVRSREESVQSARLHADIRAWWPELDSD